MSAVASFPTQLTSYCYYIHLRFKLNHWYILSVQALVTHPFGIHLRGEELEGGLREPRASPVEPKVAAALAKNRLVVVMDFFMAHAAWVDGRRIRVL